MGSDLAFLDEIIEISNDLAFQRLKPLTDFRECHDGRPKESRILYLCRQIKPALATNSEFVVKVKVQIPDELSGIVDGPSSTTDTEVNALEAFRDADTLVAPHLIAFRKVVQGQDGPLPGGYVTFTVMTKMPGSTLLDLGFWSLAIGERLKIQQRFLQALKELSQLCIEPTDRALRNILWEQSTNRCTIVDFEMWKRPSGLAIAEESELQRWGLASRPPPTTWIDEWKLQFH